MSPWDGASRWINTVLLVVVGFVGFDTLFRLLEANERNVIVGFTRNVANLLLAPFQGMFDEQEYLLTALIAVLGYALVAGIAMAVIRSVQASTRRRLEREAGPAGPDGQPGTAAWSTSAWQRSDQGPQRPGAAGADTARIDSRDGASDTPWASQTGPRGGRSGGEGDAGTSTSGSEPTSPLPNGQPRGGEPRARQDEPDPRRS